MAGRFEGRYAMLFFLLLFFIFIAYTPIPPSRYSSADAGSDAWPGSTRANFAFLSLWWIADCDVAKLSSFAKSSRKS